MTGHPGLRGDVADESAPGAPSDLVAEARMREIYHVHAPRLFGYLLGLTYGRRQVAEDLMQETFLRAWRSLDVLNADVSTLRPWLFTVARRVAIDAERARRARPAFSDAKDVADLPAVDDAIDKLLAEETIRSALPRLSVEQRRVIVEMYFHGRTSRETAALLGVPEGTVKSRAYYALRALRAAIGPIHGGRP